MSIQDEEAQRLADESDENMAAWEAGIARMKDELRAQRPELFDESGELIMERAMKLFRQRTNGKRTFTRAEFIALTEGETSRRADAS
jgi:hypothetical protein